MVPSAYLRVFQPIEAFSADEQAGWERYIVQGEGSRPPRPRYRQQPTAGRLGLLAAEDDERADVRVVAGRTYVCPWRTRLRVLSSLIALRESSPIELAEEFVPEAEVRRAQRELSRMRRRRGDGVPFILQSAWHVPIRWFVLVDDAERRLEERPEGGYRLFYETTVKAASERAVGAKPVLRRSELGPVAELIDELSDWLSVFDPGSILELDYASLCDLLSWDEMDDDHSARDIEEALTALRADELPKSAELYQSVMGRWAEVRNHETLN